MTPAGRRVQLARYRISTGTRGLYAQRIDGRVAVVDVPIDHPDHVHLVERHVHTKAELAELAAAYVQHSEQADRPAIIAQRDGLDRWTEAL